MNLNLNSNLERYFFFMFILFLIGLWGAMMNHTAIINNDCKMPVNKNYTYETQEHISYKSIEEKNKSVQNKIFSDFFKIEDIRIKDTIYNYYFSIGDILLYFACIFMFILTIHLYILEKRDIKKHKYL